jgi:diphthamide synthase (EF-2-diphthine--ammonia ligase)
MGRCFVLDGNKYFARPAPALAVGAALVARCAHDGDENVVAALERLLFYPDCAKLDDDRNLAWARVEGAGAQATELNHLLRQMPEAGFEEPDVPDIEDFDDIHNAACVRGEKFYTDPTTGYLVMTKLNHLARGKCCGSGCRHCPYNHVNVKDKASRIQNPALMHVPAAGFAKQVTVLMWSGGKDSFLALRAMLRPGGRLHRVGPSGVILLTTFDASTRVVAHQDVSARDVERQAKHLDVGLVGVPLHRNAGAGYVARLRGALDVVRAAGCDVTGLACGDLHLEHIRSWREDAVGNGLRVGVCYPVWSDAAGANYGALAADLEKSGVPCVVTAVTEDRCAEAGDRGRCGVHPGARRSRGRRRRGRVR